MSKAYDDLLNDVDEEIEEEEIDQTEEDELIETPKDFTELEVKVEPKQYRGMPFDELYEDVMGDGEVKPLEAQAIEDDQGALFGEANVDESIRQLKSAKRVLSLDDTFIMENFDEETAARTTLLGYFQGQMNTDVSEDMFDTLFSEEFGDVPLVDALAELRDNYGVKGKKQKDPETGEWIKQVNYDADIGTDGMRPTVWRKQFNTEKFGEYVRFSNQEEEDGALAFIDKANVIDREYGDLEKKKAVGWSGSVPPEAYINPETGKGWKTFDSEPWKEKFATDTLASEEAIEAKKIEIQAEFDAMPMHMKWAVMAGRDKGRLDYLNARSKNLYLETHRTRHGDPRNFMSQKHGLTDEQELEREQLQYNIGLEDQNYSRIEKLISDGKANNPYERIRVGGMRVHQHQDIMADVMAVNKAQAMVSIRKSSRLEQMASETLPEGQSFVGKMWYGTLGSAQAMGESIGLSALLGKQVVSTAYWTMEGGGSIIKDYVTMNDIDLTTMSDDDYHKLQKIALVGGGIYGAIEHLGGSYGLQGKGVSGRLYSRLINKALTNDATWNAFKRGGARFIIEWMTEAAEEGLQEVTTKVAREKMEGDSILGQAISGENYALFGKMFVEALPATLGMTGILGGGRTIHTLVTEPKTVEGYAETITGDIVEAEKLFRKVKGAKTKGERVEILNEARAENSAYIVRRTMEKRSTRKTGFRNGSDGKPVSKKEMAQVFGETKTEKDPDVYEDAPLSEEDKRELDSIQSEIKAIIEMPYPTDAKYQYEERTPELLSQFKRMREAKDNAQKRLPALRERRKEVQSRKKNNAMRIVSVGETREVPVRTEQEVRESFSPDHDPAHVDLFIEAAKGNEEARRKYNAILRGEGATPSVKAPYAPDMSIDELLPETELDENDVEYTLAMQIPSVELVKAVATYKNSGVPVPEGMRHALKARDIKLEDFLVSVQNFAGEKLYDREADLTKRDVKVSTSGDTQSQKVKAHGEARLQTALTAIEDLFYTMDNKADVDLDGLDIEALFTQAVEEGNAHVITDGLAKAGIDTKDTPLARILVDAQFQFERAKRMEYLVSNQNKASDKATIKRIATAMKVTEEQAESMYIVAKSIGLPIEEALLSDEVVNNFFGRLDPRLLEAKLAGVDFVIPMFDETVYTALAGIEDKADVEFFEVGEEIPTAIKELRIQLVKAESEFSEDDPATWMPLVKAQAKIISRSKGIPEAELIQRQTRYQDLFLHKRVDIGSPKNMRDALTVLANAESVFSESAQAMLEELTIDRLDIPVNLARGNPNANERRIELESRSLTDHIIHEIFHNLTGFTVRAGQRDLQNKRASDAGLRPGNIFKSDRVRYMKGSTYRKAMLEIADRRNDRFEKEEDKLSALIKIWDKAIGVADKNLKSRRGVGFHISPPMVKGESAFDGMTGERKWTSGMTVSLLPVEGGGYEAEMFPSMYNDSYGKMLKKWGVEHTFSSESTAGSGMVGMRTLTITEAGYKTLLEKAEVQATENAVGDMYGALYMPNPRNNKKASAYIFGGTHGGGGQAMLGHYMYGLTNVDEFASETMSDPEFREFLDKHGLLDEAIDAVYDLAVERGVIKEGKGRELFHAIDRMVSISEAQPEAVQELEERPEFQFDPQGQGILLQQGDAYQDVQSPEFKEWFKDSKLVDKDGSPLVVYHGTRTDESIDSLEARDGHQFGEGVYLAPAPEKANRYARGFVGDYGENSRVFPLYVSITNPFYTSSDEGVRDVALDVQQNNPEYYRGITEKIAKDKGYSSATTVGTTEVGNYLLRQQGYDGVIMEWEEGQPLEVVAFESEQVKSVFNRGTFDSTRPEILFQGGERDLDTPEFKAFFGDSEIVNKDGSPKVVYHGTDENIKEFDIDDEGWVPRRQVAFFSEDPKVASAFAWARGHIKDANVMPVYIKLENPFYIGSVEDHYSELALYRFLGMEGEESDLLAEMEADGLTEKDLETKAMWEWYTHDFNVLMSIKDQGYDGFSGTEQGKPVHAVFEPTQIKSKFNRGTFDSKDGRILYQGEKPAPRKLQRFSQAKTGQAFSTTAYTGRGATREEIYGERSLSEGRAFPIFGDALYVASDMDAEIYGDVRSVPVTMNNPLVIRTGLEWMTLLKEADANVLSSRTEEFFLTPEDTEPASMRLQAHLIEQGYDGVVIAMSDKLNDKILGEQFGHDQAVVFKVEQRQDPSIETEVGADVDPSQPKGAFFQKEGRDFIIGFENSDTSTGFHEIGHYARRHLFTGEAIEQGKMTEEDLATAEAFYEVENGVWTTEQEERFADDFVGWVHSGKTQKPELVGTFQKIAGWLSEIYSKIRNVSPEMTQVFNNLIARNHETMGHLAPDIKAKLAKDMNERIHLVAAREFESLIQSMRVDDLMLSPEEALQVMSFLAQRQDIETLADPIAEESLPDSIRERLPEWGANLESISQKVSELSEKLGIEFSSIEDYFPMRHAPKAEGHVEDPAIAHEQAGRNITSHRQGKFKGVVKDPVYQLNRYLQDVATFLSFGEATVQAREAYADNIVEIAVAIAKREGGEALTKGETIALEMHEELLALEEEGKKQAIKIPASVLTDEGFLDAVFRGETGLMREDFELGLLGENFLNTVDPAFVTVWMDGISFDGMKESGVFAGGNYAMRRGILKGVEEYRRNSQMAIDSVLLSARQNLTTGEAMKAFEEKMADIWSNYEKRQLLLRGGRDGSSKDFGRIGLTPRESVVALQMTQQLQLAGTALNEGSKEIMTTLSEGKKGIRDEWKALDLKVEQKTATPEDIARLKFIEKKYGDSLKNTVVNWIFERQSLRNGDFFGMYESMIDRAYKNHIIGRESAKIEAWEKVLRKQNRNEFADWWQNVRLRNLEGKLFSFEESLIETVGEKGLSLKNKALKLIGKEPSGQTIDDVRISAVTAANELHRARINAWLAGNLAWSLTTQPGSLSMTLKQTSWKSFGHALKDTIQSDYGIIVGSLAHIKNGDTPKEAIRKSRHSARQSRPSSIVREIKGTGRDLSGRAIEVSEWEEKKIKSSIRSKIRHNVTKFASAVEERTVDISILAGRHHAERLGLDGLEAEMYADFIAETTQSMYDQFTRNMMISSPTLRALAPMQSFVYTAYSNALDLTNRVGIEKDAKRRMNELIQWKTAAILWNAMWSMLMGDDPLKALFDGSMSKDKLTSHIPVLPSALQYVGIDTDYLVEKGSNIVLPEILEREARDWRVNPPLKLLQETAGAFGGETVHARDREIMLWANDYIVPHLGLPATKLSHNFIEMVYADMDAGLIRSNKGNSHGYIEGIDEQDRVEELMTYVTGIIFSKKAVDEPEGLLD